MRMKKALTLLIVLLVIFLLFLILTQHSQVWDRTYGGADRDLGLCVIQTDDEGYLIAGAIESFGSGDSDAWLIKTDSNGNVQWNKTYGGKGYDSANYVIKTDDGGYAIAGSTSLVGPSKADAWLIKTDSNGNVQWNKTYGGVESDRAITMVQTKDGGYAIAGWTWSFGSGDADFWLIKTDVAGSALWDKTYGGTGDDRLTSITQTGDGGYAIVGWTDSFGAGHYDFWLVKTDSVGNTQWNKTYGGEKNDIAQKILGTGDGGYAIAGSTGSFGAGFSDFWLIKTDLSGNIQWDKTYGGADYEAAEYAIRTDDGGYAIVGYAGSVDPDELEPSEVDFWLVKTNQAGNMQLSQTYGGPDWDYPLSLIQTGDGGYAIVGVANGLDGSLDEADLWIVKTDPNLCAIPVPFWIQWWFWAIYGGVPFTFTLLYVIRGRRDQLLRTFQNISEARKQKVDSEKIVLAYLRTHKGTIRISECAKELGITEEEVKEAISKLQKKGLIKT